MSLTQITYYFRKYAPVAGFIFVFLILLYFLFKVYFAYLDASRPKPLQISAIFGKLQRIKPSISIEYPPSPEFTLDTIEGIPQTATDTATVYFLPSKTTRLGYIQNIYLMAKNLGFDTETIKNTLNDTIATFDDGKQRFDVDVTTYNFEYKYNYEADPTVFLNSEIPEESRVQDRATQILQLLDRYPSELAQGKAQVIYLHYNDVTREFLTVPTKEEANAVEIDFYRPDINGFSSVTPTYFSSQNYVALTFTNNTYKVIKAQITFFEKEDQKSGIYPVKSGPQAWEELKTGKGIIVARGQNSSQITIKQMFLGYYDPDVYQPYLQPVYVFLGANGFAAYVPAILDQYFE